MSTERIDHVAKAQEFAAKADNPDARKTLTYSGLAQVHATLALVEQQRVANLIALGQFRVAPGDLAHFRHLVAQPSGEHSLQASPLISEALGLS